MKDLVSTIDIRPQRLIDEIESVQDFLPNESALCNWCEYPDLCPLRKHFYKVEALPVNEYLNEPGVVLANKYAQLKNQEAGMEAEMEKVREAILDYARREQVEIIKGSDCKVRVTFADKLKFPRKSDAERLDLDGIIKEAGKWGEVSDLDTTALISIVEKGLWSKDLIDRVMKYGRIEESPTVRVSKLKDQEK